MKTSRIARAGLSIVAASLLILTGCAAEPSAESSSSGEDQSEVVEEQSDGSGEEASAEGGDGDYAFGTDRDQIATSIEAGFTSENGKARWEGDTLILSVDGDASEDLAGFTQCRVLSQLLQEEDKSAVEFPNGTVDCDEVLDDD